MKKLLLSSIAAIAAATAAMGMEVILATGKINSPLFDGTFSDVGVGINAGVFMCLTDAAAYDIYANDSGALYDAWQNGDFDSAQYKFSGTTGNSSIREYFIQDFPYDDYGDNKFYAIAVATYDSAEYGRSYHIARIIFKEYKGMDPDFDTFTIGQLISGATSWSIAPEPTTTALLAFGIAAIGLKRKINN